jgi:AcrR family transcriptional regulator
MDQIAGAVPVSKMTLYNIFGSKEGLLEAVVDSLIADGVDRFDRAVKEATDPVDALNRLAKLEGPETEYTAEFLADLQAYPALLERIRQAAETVMPRFQALILEGQQKGMIRKDLSPIVVVTFLRAMKDFMTRSDVLHGLGNLHTVGDQLTTIFYHGIMTNESANRSDG